MYQERLWMWRAWFCNNVCALIRTDCYPVSGGSANTSDSSSLPTQNRMGQRALAAVSKATSGATTGFNRTTSTSSFRTAFCLHSQETPTNRWKLLRKRWLAKYEIKSTTSAYKELSSRESKENPRCR